MISWSAQRSLPIYECQAQAQHLLDEQQWPSDDPISAQLREELAEQLFQNLPKNLDLPTTPWTGPTSLQFKKAASSAHLPIHPKVAQKDCTELLLRYAIAQKRLDRAIHIAATLGIDDLEHCEQAAAAFREHSGYGGFVLICANKQRTIEQKIEVVMKLHAGDEKAAHDTLDHLLAGEPMIREVSRYVGTGSSLPKFTLFRLEECVGKFLFRDCIFPKLGNHHLTKYWLPILTELDNRSNPKHMNYSKNDYEYYKKILLVYLLQVNKAYTCTDFRYAFELLDLTVRNTTLENVQYLLDEKLANCVYSANSSDLTRNMSPDHNHGPHRVMLERVVGLAQILRTHKVATAVSRNFFIKYWTNHILRPFLGPKPTAENLEEITRNPSLDTLRMTPIRCDARCWQCQEVNEFLSSKGSRSFRDAEPPGRVFRVGSKRRRLHLMVRVQAHPCLEISNGAALTGAMTLHKVRYDLWEVVKEWKEVARLIWDVAGRVREELGTDFLNIVETAVKDDSQGWTKDHNAKVITILGIPLDAPTVEEIIGDGFNGSAMTVGSRPGAVKHIEDSAQRLRDLQYRQGLMSAGWIQTL